MGDSVEMVEQGLASCECYQSPDPKEGAVAVESGWERVLVEIKRGGAEIGVGEGERSSIVSHSLKSAASCGVKVSRESTAVSSNLRCVSSGLLSTETKAWSLVADNARPFTALTALLLNDSNEGSIYEQRPALFGRFARE